MWWLLACVADPSAAGAVDDLPDRGAFVVIEAGPDRVASAFPPPEGAVRVEGGPFGAWLGALELGPADRAPRTHDGREVHHTARVVALPLVDGDLQQCADSAIRLRAEYLRERGEPVSFHATNGQVLPWGRFAAGERVALVGERLVWKDDGSGAWEDYLSAVFTWAGTASLQRLDSVAVDRPQPGDLLVQGGFPGHAVVLLDVAERGAETFVLVGEGFMPAQEFHIELGPEAGWWRWEPGLALPHWSFDADDLRRFAR